MLKQIIPWIEQLAKSEQSLERKVFHLSAYLGITDMIEHRINPNLINELPDIPLITPHIFRQVMLVSLIKHFQKEIRLSSMRGYLELAYEKLIKSKTVYGYDMLTYHFVEGLMDDAEISPAVCRCKR